MCTTPTRRRSRLLVGLVIIALVLPAGPALAAGAFWDDDGSVHEPNVEALAGAGVTLGCDPPARSRFCPDDDVTRGQMAAMLVRALDLPEATEDRFGDDDGSVFEPDIDALAAAGITEGCDATGTAFCPTEPVTRGQMAAFLRRAYDVAASDTDAFADDDGTVFEPDIDALAAAGIAEGCASSGDPRFCPDELVSRAETASFLVRADDGLDALDPARLHERTVTYEVRAYDQDVDPDLVDVLRERAEEALYAAEGWNIQHRLLLEHVGSGGDFALLLASGDAIGAEPGCSEDYSCTIGDDILINQDNLQQRPGPWSARSQAEYQRYLVLHEVGHWLGFDDTADPDDPSHYNDESFCVDGLAPVMKQQSITTGNCSTNVYPLAFERDCVEEAWLPDTTDQGDGDGDLDDQCPHEPAPR